MTYSDALWRNASGDGGVKWPLVTGNHLWRMKYLRYSKKNHLLNFKPVFVTSYHWNVRQNILTWRWWMNDKITWRHARITPSLFLRLFQWMSINLGQFVFLLLFAENVSRNVVTSCLLWRHRWMQFYTKLINRTLALEGWFETFSAKLLSHDVISLECETKHTNLTLVNEPQNNVTSCTKCSLPTLFVGFFLFFNFLSANKKKLTASNYKSTMEFIDFILVNCCLILNIKSVSIFKTKHFAGGNFQMYS
jgi:hypothetical protein